MTSTDPRYVKTIDEQIASLAAAIDTQRKAGKTDAEKAAIEAALAPALALLEALKKSKEGKDEPEPDEDD